VQRVASPLNVVKYQGVVRFQGPTAEGNRRVGFAHRSNCLALYRCVWVFRFIEEVSGCSTDQMTLLNSTCPIE